MLARLRRALTRIPTSRDWLETALALAAFAVVVGPLGLATGLLVPEARPPGELALIALTAFFVPALGEEALFRGFLPDRRGGRRDLIPVIGSVAAFVCWHLVETIWLPGAASVFLRPDFLAAAALLGLACAALRVRSGSLWPAVGLHWAAVVAWQGWLGGPAFAALA